MLSIARETPDQVEVARLLRLADERAAALYPAESRHGLSAGALVTAGVRFFVARLDGTAVGCGGFVPRGGAAAELKRLFVVEAARGRGTGRQILRAIEDAAKREGIAVMLLETGIGSVEALGLYRRAGYRERGPFAPYGPDPLSVFLAKTLVP